MRSRTLMTGEFSHPVIAMAMVLCLSSADGLFSRSKCPDLVKEGRIKSNCQRRGLINIYDLNLDRDTRVLDLTDNDFTRLHENEFQTEGLTNLEELILHNNAVEVIDAMAFNGLSRLFLLDLSKNRISTLTLAFMPPLRSLNLSHNELSPDFKMYSETLEILDLSHCNLEIAPIRHYSDFTNLHHLNLSFNKITKLPVAIIQHMPLRSILFNENRIVCNEETSKLIKWFEKSNVYYSRICLHQSPLSQAETPASPVKPLRPIHIQKQSLLDGHQPEWTPNYEDCIAQLKSIRSEGRLFALITLALHLAILVVVIVFFGFYLSYRFEEKRVRAERVEGEEEPDDEIPPPPYRNRSYQPGFSI